MPLSKLSFESTLAELNKVVSQIEAGDLSLEDNLKAYARGNALLRHCHEILQNASQKVEVLTANLQLASFDLDSTNQPMPRQSEAKTKLSKPIELAPHHIQGSDVIE